MENTTKENTTQTSTTTTPEVSTTTVEQVLGYYPITKVRTLSKVTPEGEQRITILFERGNSATVFLSSKQAHAATGFSNNFEVLIGSKLSATFYVEGEELINGKACTKDNTIIKEFEFQFSDRVMNFKTASAAGMGMFGSMS